MNEKTVLLFGGGVLLLFVVMSRKSTSSTFAQTQQYSPVAPGVSNQQLAIGGALSALDILSNRLPGLSGNYESDDENIDY